MTAYSFPEILFLKWTSTQESHLIPDDRATLASVSKCANKTLNDKFGYKISYLSPVAGG